MIAASANKVTVPGDNRLDELKLGNKTPFWHKIPIIKELRVAVGWQKGMLITGLVLTAFFLLVAIFAPLIAPYSYAQLKGADGVSFPAQAAPSSEHIWGTTAGGYDVFSRVVWGARTAVIAIVVAVLLSIFAGVLLGLVSGYFGGWVDRVLVMIADAVYSFPSLLLAILMAIMISHGQSGLWSGIFASGISITVVYIPQYFRTIRAEVIRIKESAYVESARVVGASTWRIMTKHLFKNSTRTLPVILTLNSSEAILTLAGLGFLGFGIEPTAAAEWGYDLNRAVSDVTAGIWWTAVFPGLAIVLIVLGITLGLTGYANIWPLFGASNQLLAALGLLAVATWLGKAGKNNKMFYIPMIFMLVVTLTSLVFTLQSNILAISAGGAGLAWCYVRVILAALLIILAIILAVDSIRTMAKQKKLA